MNEHKNRNWITDGIIIALVPFLGYLFAFQYESGYAIYFNFPQELISIGLPQIIMTLSILTVVIMLLFFIVEMLSMIVPGNKRALYRNVINILPITCYSIGYLFAYGFKKAAVFIFLFVIFGFERFVLPLFVYRDKKDYNSKIQADEDATWKFREERNALSVRILRIFGQKEFMIILNLVLCVYFTQMVGEIIASEKNQFIVSSNDPQKVIVRIYGDNAICASFDRKANIIKKDISIYKLASPEVQNMKFEKIEPLRVK